MTELAVRTIIYYLRQCPVSERLKSWEGNGAVGLFGRMSGICLLLQVLEPLTLVPQVMGMGDLPSPSPLQVTPFASSVPLSSGR